MKHPLISIAIALGLLSATCATNAWAVGASDKVLIEEVLEKVIAGKNGEEMASYYAPDAILWDVLPPETRGRKAIGEFMDGIMTDQKNLKGEIRRLHIEVDRTLATAYSIQHFTWESKATGQPGEILFRQTDMLRKIKGRWWIIHQHISVPIDVKTGMPVWKFE